MTKALKKDAKYADLCAVPENFVAEILGAELYASPRPVFSHARVVSALGMLIGGPFQFGVDGPGGWLLLDEPELRLRDDVLVPDLAAWRRERLPAVSTGEYPAVAPDWICEVLSPRTASVDQGKKRRAYHSAGVEHYWLVDPTNRTLTVLARAELDYLIVLVAGPDEVVKAPPFDAVEIAVGDIFGEEDRPKEAPDR